MGVVAPAIFAIVSMSRKYGKAGSLSCLTRIIKIGVKIRTVGILDKNIVSNRVSKAIAPINHSRCHCTRLIIDRARYSNTPDCLTMPIMIVMPIMKPKTHKLLPI